MPGTLRETAVFVRGADGAAKTAIVVTLEYREEKGAWLAECIELGTAAFGTTLDEAQDDLRDAISLQLNEVEKLGFATDFLQEHGVVTVAIPSSEPSAWSLAPTAPAGV